MLNKCKLLLLTFLLLYPTSASPQVPVQCYKGTNAVADTVLSVITVDQPQTWTDTGFHIPVRKLQNDSNFVYTTTITFQYPSALSYGARFQIRVRDADTGEDIMAHTGTGEVNKAAFAWQNASIADTVFDARVGKEPPTGNYVFELWALTGGSSLQILPRTTNLVIMEIPHATPC